MPTGQGVDADLGVRGPPAPMAMRAAPTMVASLVMRRIWSFVPHWFAGYIGALSTYARGIPDRSMEPRVATRERALAD